ncbi:MAG TPA: DinB family protein [Vicinamibacteria bacterium]
MMRRDAQEELFRELEAMPDFLTEAFGRLSPEEAAAPGPEGAFSPVEHCWHLADLERLGFGKRIERLRAETEPFLPDFDGARIAREREYRKLSLAEGIDAFRRARRANLEALKSLEPSEWLRKGEQEGVGPVALCDIPSMMAEHDLSHRSEIEDWLNAAD